jgi:hypothetical protein
VTLPSKERLLYLRDFVERNKEHANQNVGGPMSFSTYDTIALLDAAIALRRLEACVHVHIEREALGWFVRAGSDFLSARAVRREPDLLAALVAALEKAGAK